MNVEIRHDTAEGAAKAALLEYLRATGELNSKVAAILELGIAKLANRADIALVGESIHCFEIKTRRDTLSRLGQQLDSYLKASNFVTVVCATRHMNTAMSRVPDYVGLLELVDFNDRLQVRLVRPALASPLLCASLMLDYLPASELRKRLVPDGPRMNRAGLITAAEDIELEKLRFEVTDFLRQRYLPNTKAFLKSVNRRRIRERDLATLRKWLKVPAIDELAPALKSFSVLPDSETFHFISDSFGPVPADIKRFIS